MCLKTFRQEELFPILYVPEHPEQAILDGFTSFWAPALQLLDAGAVLMLLGLFSQWWQQRRKSPQLNRSPALHGWLMLGTMLLGVAFFIVMAVRS